MSVSFTESVVEQSALAWFENAGWLVRNGAKITPGGSWGRAHIRVRSVTTSCNADTLAALRDTLLPKLVSGGLRVKDAERFIGRAV